MKKTASTQMDRRSFLQVTALAGGGVIIGMYAPDVLAQGGRGGPQIPWSLAPADYITTQIPRTILAKNPETDSITALPQIIADEFDIDWSQVRSSRRISTRAWAAARSGSRRTPTNPRTMRQPARVSAA
jgi:isoquinoline 1-oxidoreductase beta subunit